MFDLVADRANASRQDVDVGAVDSNGNGSGSGSRVFRRAQLPEQVQAASRPPERQHMILPPQPDLHRFDELEREREREGRPVASNANAIASTNSSSARERDRDRDWDRARALERDKPAMPTHVGRASLRPYKQPLETVALAAAGAAAGVTAPDARQLGDPSALYQGVCRVSCAVLSVNDNVLVTCVA